LSLSGSEIVPIRPSNGSDKTASAFPLRLGRLFMPFLGPGTLSGPASSWRAARMISPHTNALRREEHVTLIFMSTPDVTDLGSVSPHTVTCMSVVTKSVWPRAPGLEFSMRSFQPIAEVVIAKLNLCCSVT